MKITMPDGSAAWLVTEYDDVRALLADPRLSLDKKNSGGGYVGFKLPPALDANLLNMDPPDHTRIRRLVTGAFTARRVEAMRPAVEATADRLLDGLQGTVDLMAAYAGPLPVITIAGLLGVPADRVEDFRGWTDSLISQGSRDAVKSMYGFMVELIAAKRAEPADDLISDMIAARDGADRLTEDELLSLAFLILLAGYENSVHLIGNSILTLLREGPAGTEELLRTANPNLHAIRRFLLEDIEVGDVTILKGQTVLLDIQAANTSGPKHLTFGAGIHHCVGAPLARLELEVAVGRLFSKFPDASLAVPVETLPRRDSFRSHGLLELPVKLTP